MTDSCANKLKKERKKNNKVEKFQSECLKCEGEEEKKVEFSHIR